MTTPDPAAAIEEALAKATEGPWFVHDFSGAIDPKHDPAPGDVTVSCDHPATITVAFMGRALTATVEEAQANAAFIAAAKTHLPTLLAEIAGLREAVKTAVEDEFDRLLDLAWRDPAQFAVLVDIHSRGAALEKAPVPAGVETEREASAKLVEAMIEQRPYRDKPDARMALAIAARAVRRGRHLTETEKLGNLKRSMDEWEAEEAALARPEPGQEGR